MTSDRGGIALTFPGQGSFDPRLLRNLYLAFNELRPLYHSVDAAAGDILGLPFLHLILAEDAESNADAAQLGIYLANCGTARLWIKRGISPSLLLGHSFGELAALATAGVFSIADGARIVCQRILSLRQTPCAGRMLAISASVSAVGGALQEFAQRCSVAVVNHSGQTVVSGPEPEVEELKKRLAARGISSTHLKSPYPFHSPLLEVPARSFEIALRAYRYESPTYPVFIGTEQRLVDCEVDIPMVLARTLVTPLNFESGLKMLYGQGHSTFVECGSGAIVTRIISTILKAEREHRTWATFPTTENPGARLAAMVKEVSGQPKASNANAHPAPLPEQTDTPAPVEQAPFEPIAIVGMGCVLPGGANSPDQFWDNLTKGVNGIVDLTQLDPHAREDFVAGGSNRDAPQIVPDKTYTLLSGSIVHVGYDSSLLDGRVSQEQFDLLTKGQKILALSMAQLARTKGAPIDPARLQCILGSTADGSGELDESHFASSVRSVLAGIRAAEADKQRFTEALARHLPGFQKEPDALAPHKQYAGVAKTLLGVPEENTYLVDSACSSSLYSLALGARALRSGEADLVYAGGVFAPGPANNTLFAQFRGLTPTGSRPFDAKADGVVFGDGAAILVLKRLSDAVADGDSIAGVIRADGLSSDGKSPSINVPQAEGQVIALQAAYIRGSLDPKTVQYVEAHATATPVGDAVELKAIKEALPALSGQPRYIGSVKALIGHTGWTSGAASVIKVCKAIQHRRIPRQFHYENPNPNLGLNGNGTPLVVPTQELDWPDNVGGVPRRAAINGFGFGGTNGHLVVEEYREAYHRALAAPFREKSRRNQDVVIVAAEALVPDSGHSFDRKKQLRMPKNRLVLPDIAEHMDPTQYLAAMTAEKMAATVAPGKAKVRVGVALGIEGKTERSVRANERIFLDRLCRIGRAHGVSTHLMDQIRKAVQESVIPSGPYTLPGLMPNVAASRITHTFNWHGPNLVIDRGTGSFVQAIDAAVKLVEAGDCDVILAGAINAWTGHTKGAKEASALIALATAETAAKLGLPVIGRIQLRQTTQGHPTAALDADTSYRGATGAAAAVQAIRSVAQDGKAKSLTWGGTAVMTILPSADAVQTASPSENTRPAVRGSHAYVEGTPIQNYTPVLRAASPLNHAGPRRTHSYLFLTDQPEAWRSFQEESSLRGINFAVAAPAGCGVLGAVEIDVSTEESANEGLRRLHSLKFDTIVALKHLAGVAEEQLMAGDFHSSRLLDLLFAVAREYYPTLGERTCSLATICLDGLHDGNLRPFTGLFAGFLKSLARELPQCQCRAIATDEVRLSEALAQADAELDAEDRTVEVAYVGRRRLHNVLVASPAFHRSGPGWVDKDSVVLATGGGRGVTAVLAELALREYGCTVIALGRTDPTLVPVNLRDLDEAAFAAYASQFYREELARDSSRKMPELKALYERYQASHELTSVIRRARALPGRYEYIQCDITDPREIDSVISRVVQQYGRLDVILHGAGVQVSKAMPRKSPLDFRRIVNTKLGSFASIYQACRKLGIESRLRVHLLTSAFSYLGNDGQPDYGAANEALNRLALHMNGKGDKGYWSSMAWLGWAGIGMTRGTEYAALAASRRLRGVTREEGQGIFADAMAGPPATPINVLLAQGEIEYYRPEFAPPATAVEELPSEIAVEWDISPERMPFLADHLVRGVPTLPGSFLIAMAGDAALKLRPDLKIAQFERTRFLRLIRAFPDRPNKVKAIARIEREGEETTVQVQIVMDIVHKSGLTLAGDQLHTEIFVRMGKAVHAESSAEVKLSAGSALPDPYVRPGSPVSLNGAFRTIKQIVVGKGFRTADYRFRQQKSYGSEFDHLLPNVILVDAFWRFGTVRESETGNLAVYVPERCDRMKVFFDYSDFGAELLHGSITFQGANPSPDGDALDVGPIEAVDGSGRMLLRVEGGRCRRFGEVEMRQ